MILPKSLKSYIAIFRGDVSPALIVLSVALGFWFGATPGLYGVHMLLLVLALILNLHVGLFLMFAGFGKALCFAATPVWFYAGRWVQDSLGFVLDAFAAAPIVGLTDFARCSVAGSLIIGPLLGVLAGVLLARSVGAFRRAWLSLENDSEAFKKWHDNRWVKLLDRLLIGKRTKDVRAALERKPKYIRIPGVVMAIVLIAALVVGLNFLPQERLKNMAAEALTRANGAEVNLESLELTAFSGRVTARGVHITDPANPENNRIAVGELTADAGLLELSRGRIVMDRVALTSVTINQPRAAAGSTTKPPSLPAADEPPSASSPFDPASYNLPSTDAAKLETYFRNAEQARDWFAKVSQWLPDSEKTAPPPPEPPKPQSWLEYLTARTPTPPTPRIIVKKIVLDDVDTGIDQIGRGTITCKNLSDAPEAAGLPLTIHVKSSEKPAELIIVCRYDRPKGGAEIEGDVADISLQSLQDDLNPNNPVIFEDGAASAAISGDVNRLTVDLTVLVKTQGMKANPQGGLFGLDPQVTSEALRVVQNIETPLRIVGPARSPRLAFDGPALTNEFKNALTQAGKAELARRVDDLLAQHAPEGVPKTDDILKDPAAAAGAALSGFLADKEKKGEEKEKEKEKEDEKKKEDTPLSRLKERLKKPD